MVLSSRGPTEGITWRQKLLLAGLGLALALAISRIQPFPGYLDSDYYFAGGIQLANGRGFSEPYLWNYLDDPQGLPHPSHGYWMPLASIISAAGMWLTGQSTYAAGRLGFLAISAAVPVATASLGYRLSQRRELAFASGLLGVFSIYYVPFLPVPDNYGSYLVLGALFFIAVGLPGTTASIGTGFLAGLMVLARSDGLLWLALAALNAMIAPALGSPLNDSSQAMRDPQGSTWDRISGVASRLGLVLLGFAIVVAPWWLRNYSVYGSVLTPGGNRLLWLTSYDDTFAFPADTLTYERWAAQGTQAILSVRVSALSWNLLNALAAQGGIFVFPFILVGAWLHRHDRRVQLGALGWVLLLLVMTVAFPFAGSRGGFFHAGAGLQSLWWGLAPLGLEATVSAARRRGLFTPHAFLIFRIALVALAAIMTGAIIWIRVLPGWGEGEEAYPRIEAFLQVSGAQPGDVVMVRNPPGYYILTGRQAIVVPFAGAEGMQAAASKYGADYMVLEEIGAAGPMKEVYRDLNSATFRFLGELDGTRIYRLQP